MRYEFTPSGWIGLACLAIALGLMLWANIRRRQGGKVWPLFVAVGFAVVGAVLVLGLIPF